MSDIRELLRSASHDIGVPLNDDAVSLFLQYCDELLFWNRKMSLTSIRSPSDIAIKHFVDSLTIVPLIPSSAVNILDVGSGAGFPGIPVKIVLQDCDITLLEPSRKKSSFLRHVIRSLSLSRISVRTDRLENLIQRDDPPPFFDVIVTRATLTLGDSFRAAPLLTHGGRLILMKGTRDSFSTDLSNNDCPLSLRLLTIRPLRLPLSGDERHLVLFEKI